MDVVRLSILRPIGVAVGAILLVMFGLIGLGAIKVQLTPTVDRPIVTVQTNWPGRSPEEIVDQITKEQEERLKNLPNLKTMQSVSSEGSCTITLEFYIGSNIDRSLQEVSDRLRQVPEYPDEVDEPFIEAAEGAAENAIAWMILDIDPRFDGLHDDFDITTLYDALDKQVKPYLERVDGVAQINVYGGREREVRVQVDSLALAQRQLSVADMMTALRGENRNVSAGTIAEGKRDYRVRVVGQYTDPDQVLETVIAYRAGRPVYVRDVAQVEVGYVKQRGFVRSFGRPCIAINCIRKSNANVMDVMTELKSRVEEVKTDILPRLDRDVGPHLRLRQVYDETTYISSAIDLVTQNLWVGGTIAGIVLLLFLRSFVSTGVIALAIPLSVIGTFLVLLALGRTLNVISLAGLAFAVGMVVDNAIVVLENIYRRVQLGESPMQAALRGGREVWGAILASTLTTVAVFIPVLTIEEEAGQLFRDISLAIVASVSLSLIVSITVIPAACSRWMRPPSRHGTVRRSFESLFGLVKLCSWAVTFLGFIIGWLINGWRGWSVRPTVIIVMAAASIYGAVTLAPPMDYLPAGNRNLVFGGLLIPPGYSVDQTRTIAQRIEAQLLPYAEVDSGDKAAVAGLPKVTRFGDERPYEPVPVENFFIGAFGGTMFCGATSGWEQIVIPVGQIVTNAMGGTPDAFGGASQASLFGRGFGGGGNINVEISGPDLDRVTEATKNVFMNAMRVYGPGALRPNPANFSVQQQEWQLVVNETGRELGLTNAQIGQAVRGLFDGAYVDDFLLNGDNVDMVLLPSNGRLDYKEQLATIPITTPTGAIVPLDSVVDLRESLAPQQILRIEEQPAISISIRPPQGRALEEVEQEIVEQVIDKAREAGLIDPSMRVRLEGSAAQLDEVKHALFGAPHQNEPLSDAMRIVSAVLLGVFLVVAVVLAFRAKRSGGGTVLYAAAGAAVLGVVLAALTWTVGEHPAFMTARFIWALVVTYLLMCALFESFLYPFVIMFSVPLAVVGGFGGLAIVHQLTLNNPLIATQQLDMLTMLGFVILIGVVVNNAILLVHQALLLMRGGDGDPPVPAHDAIVQSVRTRVRPIMMSTLTSVGGMMPLVLFPGAGSEMYRGLGSVVIGGLLVSTVFTLVLVPLTFSLVIDMASAARTALGFAPIGGGAASLGSALASPRD